MLAKMQTPTGFQTQPTSPAWRFSWSKMGSKAFSNRLVWESASREQLPQHSLLDEGGTMINARFAVNKGMDLTSMTAGESRPILATRLEERVKKMNQWINSPLRGESVSTLCCILHERLQKQQDSDLTTTSH